MERRILFTTAVEKMPDYFSVWANRRFLRYSLPVPALGLRFIKANFPEIEVLEYPSWKQYEAELRKGVDILGISFYTRNGNEIPRMIELAKKYGVKEIWGGNYGILTPELARYFDRTFMGYAEEELSLAIRGEGIKHLIHPSIPTTMGFNLTPFRTVEGFLFTTRGCPFRCDFCQTPAFIKRVSTIPLDTIEEVLIEYKKMGINILFIADENFLTFRKHGEEVLSLLQKYDMSWASQTRIDNIRGRVAELKEMGMFNVMFGIESFNEENLRQMHKRETVERILDTIEEMSNNDIYMHGNYIIGYENDTEESIKTDIERLAKMDIQSTQLTILTPFPMTPVYDRIKEHYGIFETDYSKFDTYHLTWNHPHISKERIETLLRWGIRRCNRPSRMIEGYRKMKKLRLVGKMVKSGPVDYRLLHWIGVHPRNY